MRRPYHRVGGGRGSFDGIESNGRGGLLPSYSFSSLCCPPRIRFSSRWCYGLLAVLITGVLIARITSYCLKTAFQVQFLPDERLLPAASASSASAHGSMYTIRVNTFRRNDMLKGFLQHFSTCPNVESIQVVWSDQENPPPPLSFFDLPSPIDAEHTSKIFFERQPTDSLNNRFRNLTAVSTAAVVSLDDDLVIPCDTLDFAFSVWQATPQSLVGFTPRLITWEDKKIDTPSKGYLYQDSFKYVWWHGRYNLILTKCCFLHRDFLPLYFSSLSEEMLAYIDEHRNCEDIAMQFVVSNHTQGVPPTWVKARFTDHGQKSGISQGKDHKNERSACVARLVQEFGGHMPLTSTTHKAVDARQEWIF